MTCPDCGYMMTAFEKECPRCEKNAKPMPAATLVKTSVPDTEPQSLAFAKAEQPELNWDPPSPFRKLIMPAACLGAAIIGGLIYGHFSQATDSSVSRTSSMASPVAFKDALAILKAQGNDQCSAGDEEGCHYFMDKLRDHGSYGDSEYLKAKLIVSHYINSHEMLYQDQQDFPRNKLSAESLRGLASVAAADGDKSAMDSCIFLADTPPPVGFPMLPASVPASKSVSAPAPVPAVTPAPAYQMTTKAGGGKPPDVSQLKTGN